VQALSGYVLGIRPVAAGWARWVVEPQTGDLHWAQGQAPTPAGAVLSRWQRGPGSFALTAGGPRSTLGEVSVPLLGRSRTIARDGRIVWQDGHAVGPVRASQVGDYVRFDGVRGVHTWAWGAVGSSSGAATPRLPATGPTWRFPLAALGLLLAAWGSRSYCGTGAVSYGVSRRRTRTGPAGDRR
jgi:alpha-L-rhamnosidase